MKKILISGYLGYENFGDEALLNVLIRDLLQVGFKREDVTVLSNNPSLTSTTHKINAINRWNIFEFISTLLKSNVIIFIGGLFQDITSFKSLLYYLFQMLLANLFQKEVALYAIGIGPLKKAWSQSLFSFFVKFTRFVTVRDQASASLSPYGANTIITCDAVWTIKPDYSFQNKISSINWQLPIMGISLRNDKNLKDYHMNTLADKISKILSTMKDWQVILIPCMVNEDLPVLYELMDLLSRKSLSQGKISIIENFNEFPILQQAGIIASCDVMIGMRYHALLIPLANGKPVFGLMYDQKVKSLIEYSGQVGVTFKDNFDQPWNYFWQNLQYSGNLARAAEQKTSQLHKVNLELLQTLHNL